MRGFKCPYNVKDLPVLEGWEKTDFFELHDKKIRLKRSHKYYTQVIGQIALSGCKNKKNYTTACRVSLVHNGTIGVVLLFTLMK